MPESESVLTMETPAVSSDASLGWRLGFWSLIVTQFQGAFSDNALKWLVSFLLLGMGLEQEKRDLLFVLVVPLLFAIPFLLFSMTGGYLADRFSKRSVTAGLKVMEICVMVVALAGLAAANLLIAAGALFLLSTQAALFGPSKYGLLPELLPEKRLVVGQRRPRVGNLSCEHQAEPWRAVCSPPPFAVVRVGPECFSSRSPPWDC